MSAELYTPTPDYFELTGPLQPKRVVGEYVASADIPVLVPTIYDDLEEAQHAAEGGVEVLARSEHPDEYNGPSGLGHTATLERDASGIFLPKYNLSSDEKLYRRLERYAQVAGLDSQAYMEQASVSYWQKIPGRNVTIVADDAIEGRYHIFGFQYRGRSGVSAVSGAVITENGEIERTTDTEGRDKEFASRYREIVDTYNAVRSLDKFSASHCPIIEMQISNEDDQIYFLQYHRARDTATVTERLDSADFNARDGWVQADAVRGAYLGDKALALTLWYPGFRDGHVKVADITLPEDGYNGMDCSFYDLNETIGRQRIAHVIATSFESQYRHIAANHGPRSQMFKPQASILIGRHDRYGLIPEDLSREAFALAYRGSLVRLETQVVSDGRDAYVNYGDELIVA